MELLQPAPPAPWLDDSWSTVEVQPWTGWSDEDPPAQAPNAGVFHLDFDEPATRGEPQQADPSDIFLPPPAEPLEQPPEQPPAGRVITPPADPAVAIFNARKRKHDHFALDGPAHHTMACGSDSEDRPDSPHTPVPRPEISSALLASHSRQLEVDEVAAILTAPAEALSLAPRPMVGTQPWALHMETERVPRKYNSGRGPECQSDQWRNSGGKKGSTKLTPTRRGLPTIMRRYGLVRCRSTGHNMRYHEYLLRGTLMSTWGFWTAVFRPLRTVFRVLAPVS